MLRVAGTNEHEWLYPPALPAGLDHWALDVERLPGRSLAKAGWTLNVFRFNFLLLAFSLPPMAGEQALVWSAE
jgi:hypothetical protein